MLGKLFALQFTSITLGVIGTAYFVAKWNKNNQIKVFERMPNV
jgi:hypothetical protein